MNLFERAARDALTDTQRGAILRGEAPIPSGLTGILLIARGNDQRYFIHLRRTGVSAPIAFYRAGFDVTSEWCETRLPFALFTASNGGIPALWEGSNLASVGIVAYGRNHHADICVSEIGF
ncbi:MAG: CIA30 family protein [Sandarakinorhabdus sp.]|nr:CIA30 family protein [Sandarakinorhabdus sp.]